MEPGDLIRNEGTLYTIQSTDDFEAEDGTWMINVYLEGEDDPVVMVWSDTVTLYGY